MNFLIVKQKNVVHVAEMQNVMVPVIGIVFLILGKWAIRSVILVLLMQNVMVPVIGIVFMVFRKRVVNVEKSVIVVKNLVRTINHASYALLTRNVMELKIVYVCHTSKDRIQASRDVNVRVVPKVNYLIIKQKHVVYVRLEQPAPVAQSTLAILDMKDREMGVVLIRVPLVLLPNYIRRVSATRVLLGRYVMGRIQLSAIRQLVTHLAQFLPLGASERIVVGRGAIPPPLPIVLLVQTMQNVMVLMFGIVNPDIIKKELRAYRQ